MIEQDEGPTDPRGEAMSFAVTVISNVSGGDWSKQTQEWQDAARRCLDDLTENWRAPVGDA